MRKKTNSKKLLSLILALAMLVSLALVPASAATSAQQQAAEALHDAGLFNGTGSDADGNPIFALDKDATRAEALTMLVRLIGMEDTARAGYESGEYAHPFTDVADWFAPYAAYAYTTEIAKGVSATKFGSATAATATQYLTFVLRALKYEDGKDFEWDKAWEKTDELGITYGNFSRVRNTILRGDMAVVSLAALLKSPVGAEVSLISLLVSQEAVDFTVEELAAFNTKAAEIVAAAAAEKPTYTAKYIAFTSDTHYNADTATGENPFKAWMDNLTTVVDNVDYLAVCGDLASAYVSNPAEKYWNNAGALMALADEYVDSGFVLKKNLFLFGNHEWWNFGGGNYAENKDNEAAKRLLPAGQVIEEDEYVLYTFSPDNTDGEGLYGNEYGAAQQYTKANIDALEAYLKTASSDIPVFVLGHFPIHTYSTPESTEDRRTGNAEYLIEMLNNYPNVIFLWGHNHSSADPSYDKVIKPGDEILTGALADGVMMKINFHYAAAGCMTDYEYRSSPESEKVPGGALIEGKGLLAAVDGKEVSLTWYDKDGKALEASDKITIG